MKLDTPLTEVATYLPRDGAHILSQQTLAVQENVLVNVRTAVCLWEAKGIQYDPIQLEAAINALVVILIGTLVPLVEQVALLSSRLKHADQLVSAAHNAMTEYLKGQQ